MARYIFFNPAWKNPVWPVFFYWPDFVSGLAKSGFYWIQNFIPVHLYFPFPTNPPKSVSISQLEVEWENFQFAFFICLIFNPNNKFVCRWFSSSDGFFSFPSCGSIKARQKSSVITLEESISDFVLKTYIWAGSEFPFLGINLTWFICSTLNTSTESGLRFFFALEIFWPQLSGNLKCIKVSSVFHVYSKPPLAKWRFFLVESPILLCLR